MRSFFSLLLMLFLSLFLVLRLEVRASGFLTERIDGDLSRQTSHRVFLLLFCDRHGREMTLRSKSGHQLIQWNRKTSLLEKTKKMNNT